MWVGLYHPQTAAAHFRTAGVGGRYGLEVIQERPVVVVDEVHVGRGCARPGYSYYSDPMTAGGGQDRCGVIARDGMPLLDVREVVNLE